MFEKINPLDKKKVIGKDKEFLNLKVIVFRNKRNGQMMVTLPKKILKDIPKKMNIKLPIKYFKITERRNN